MTSRPAPVPAPAPPADPGGFPTSLTFYLSAAERATVLTGLARLNRDRTKALLGLLGTRRRRPPAQTQKGTHP